MAALKRLRAEAAGAAFWAEAVGVHLGHAGLGPALFEFDHVLCVQRCYADNGRLGENAPAPYFASPEEIHPIR